MIACCRMVLQHHSQGTDRIKGLADQLALLEKIFLVELVVLDYVRRPLANFAYRSEIAEELRHVRRLGWLELRANPFFEELDRALGLRNSVSVFVGQVAIEFQISPEKITVQIIAQQLVKY